MKHLITILCALAAFSSLQSQDTIRVYPKYLGTPFNGGILADTNWTKNLIINSINGYDHAALEESQAIIDTAAAIRADMQNISGDNIYNSDGTLTDNRLGTFGNYHLTFTNTGGTGRLQFNPFLNQQPSNYIRSAITMSRDADVSFTTGWNKTNNASADWSAIIKRNGRLGFYTIPSAVSFSGMSNANFRDTYEHLSITDAGNVGVGFYTPGAKFEVRGDAIMGTTDGTEGLYMRGYNNTGIRLFGTQDDYYEGRETAIIQAPSERTLLFELDGNDSSDEFAFAVDGSTNDSNLEQAFSINNTGHITLHANYGSLSNTGTEVGLIGIDANGVLRNSRRFNFKNNNYLIGNTTVGQSLTTGNYNTFINYKAGENTTTANYNVAIGAWAGVNVNGNYNVMLGYYAGNQTTTGVSNVYLGSNAGRLNQTGNYNTAIGHNALYGATGNYNAAIGRDALRYQTTAVYNFAVGFRAGRFTTTGGYNNFIGRYAGYTNTTGDNNNYIGNQAGFGNTTGVHNIGIGNNTLYYNQTSSHNIALGYLAAQNTTVAGQIAVGYRASRFVTTGTYNISIGHDAGYDLTTGGDNISIGRSSGPSDGTVIRTVSIGRDAEANESYEIRLGAVSNTVSLGGYGSGNKTGTETYILAVDSEGDVIEKTVASLQDGFEANTDNQDLIRTGDVLSLTNDASTVDLSDLRDGFEANTDDQNISGSSLSGTDLIIGIEDGNSQTIDMSPLQNIPITISIPLIASTEDIEVGTAGGFFTVPSIYDGRSCTYAAVAPYSGTGSIGMNILKNNSGVFPITVNAALEERTLGGSAFTINTGDRIGANVATVSTSGFQGLSISIVCE